jgi:hypothetical protein
VGVEVIKNELDRLYEFEIDKYIKEVDDLKRMGYKIYRNSEGKHKVVERSKPQQVDIYSAFGGIFGDIFGGGQNA